ncbi:MAG: hypothetical protein ACD_60C00090G0022 [uncultured bacterium]|nr:MAG: hypothetical protein ACD_60C00090G0022 [uncultured bacterium]
MTHNEDFALHYHEALQWPERLSALSFARTSDFLNCLKPLLDALCFSHKSRYIFESLPYQLEHLDCYGFLHIMKLLNFQHEKCSIALKYLDRRLLPCLFVRQDEKVFIILAMSQHELTVFDGENNCLRKIKLTEIQDSKWCGDLYVFREMDPKESEQHPKKWFSTVVDKFKPILWQTIVINFFLNILSLATPIFIMVVYDHVIAANSLSALANISIGLLLTIIAATALQFMQNKILANVGARLDITANDSIMQHIFLLPLPYLENAPINSQLAKIKNFDSIRDFFSGPTIGLFLDFLFTLIFVLVIGLLAGNLVWIPLATILVVFISSIFLWGYFKGLMKEAMLLNIEQQNLWLEILLNIRSIKYTHSEKTWLERFKKKSADLAFSFYRLNVANNIILSTFDAIITINAVAILGFGAIKILHNELSVGALIATMILLWRILTPIKSVYTLISRFDQVRASIDQVNALMRLETEFQDIRFNDQITIRGYLTISNVSFRYSPKLDPALLSITFKAKPNEILAITGPSASGKSTLLKLILGLYQPQMGYIQLDGHDLRQFNLHELRHQIGFSPNEIVFFNGTIEQNLLLAKPDATLEQMYQALKMAFVYDDIMQLPHQLTTVLKKHDHPLLPMRILQRLVLARTFLKNATLILIDRTIDRLNGDAKQKLIFSLNELKKEKTIIITTADRDLLNNADRILILDKGRLIAEGDKNTVLNDQRLKLYFQGGI